MYRLTPGWPINIETGESVNPDSHPGYLAWLAAKGNTPLPYEPPTVDPKEQARVELAASDKAMARIVEDLISILTSKGIINMADLPVPVASKLSDRAALRKVLQADDD